MPTAQQDTEITLGTGRMLGLFFVLVLICAFFFSIGFSLGRKTVMAGSGSLLAATTPSTVVRPSAAKNSSSQPAPQSGDFSFYKAVGEKNTDATLTPADAKAQSPTSTAVTPSGAETPKADSSTGASAPTPSTTVGYFVQVAAVSRQEDAEALVEALKKKQYPAFIATNPSNDKFQHVQVGPYAEWKDAEAMRVRLVSDGYNPIVKK